MFAEKVRALSERLRPRDLYDVILLYRHKELNPDLSRLMFALREKCAFKNIGVPEMVSIRESPLVTELQVSWGQMLAHQLPELPPFEGFWAELPYVFDWLYERADQPVLRAIAISAETDTGWRMPAMANSWRGLGIGAPLEMIRFAAANRMCVQLDYRKEGGEMTQPVIEPYSLRRTRDGNYLLYGVKADTGEDRSYRVDRISGAMATRRAFKARYLVELTETGSRHVPDMALRSVAPAVAFRLPKPSGAKRKRTITGGPKYLFRCSSCGKTFTRSTHDSTLNAHKNKQGYPCVGRAGVFVKTQY